MPRGDGTGPMGMGPMTGRAAGYCAGVRMPGYANHMPGHGFGGDFSRGHGFRGRHGRRQGFRATGLPGWMRFSGYAEPSAKPDPESEQQALKNYTEELQSELDAVKVRLAEIETAAAKVQ